VPAFVKEFAGLVKRRNGGFFNPNVPAPPRPEGAAAPARPLSAVLPASPRPQNLTAANRRKSDFMSRYEDIAVRAHEALRLADALQFKGGATAADDLKSPEPEEVEFNEEEVLRTCQDFIKDYDLSKKRRSLTEKFSSAPTPRPRDSLRPQPSSNLPALHLPSGTTQTTTTTTTTTTETAPVPSPRTRSASLTVLDARSPGHSHGGDLQHLDQQHHSHHLKSILKKSSEDLFRVGADLDSRPVPILKHKESESSIVGGGILKKKSAAADDSGPVKPDHIRIRSPSPNSMSSQPRTILRSRNNSLCDDRPSSPELQSILKRR
jgi:hypothetical protein